MSLQRLVLNVLSVPATAIIIHGLGPDSYGRWVTSVALVTAVAIFASLGLRAPFVRSVARDPASAEPALAGQLGLRGVLSLLAAGISFLLAVVLHYPAVVLQCTAIVALSMVVNTVNTTLMDLLQGLERFRVIAAAGFISGFLLTVASVIAVWRTGNPVWLACSYALGPLTSTAVALFHLRRCRFAVHVRFGFGRGWQLLKESRHFSFQQVLGTLAESLSGLMLPKLVSPAEFGTYSAGALVADRLEIVPDAIGTALYPSVSRMRRQDPIRAARHAILCVGLAVLACIAVAIVATGLSHLIAVLLLPKVASQCQRVILISVWSLPLVALDLGLGSSLTAAGREDLLSRASLISALINLFVGVSLLVFAGVDGACWFIVARPLPQIACLMPSFLRLFLRPDPALAVEVDKAGEARTAMPGDVLADATV